jgi:hypothetical protein
VPSLSAVLCSGQDFVSGMIDAELCSTYDIAWQGAGIRAWADHHDLQSCMNYDAFLHLAAVAPAACLYNGIVIF